MENADTHREHLSELAVSELRAICAEHAKEALASLEDNLSADRVNKGILRRIAKRIILDHRLAPWFEQMELAMLERYIPSRLHVLAHHDYHNASRNQRSRHKPETWPMFMTLLVSNLSIADPDIFLDPMEFLFEEYENELVPEDNIVTQTFPASWTRRDALIVPHKAVFELLNWEKSDLTTAFSTWKYGEKHLLYPFRAYSARFDDPSYSAYSLIWLMTLGDQLRFNDSWGIKTRSILMVPVHIGPQSVGSFCFTSERRTSFADRVGLAQLASEITNWYLDAETELLERRRQLTTVTVPTSLAFTHEARHTLSSLDTSLRDLARVLAKGADASTLEPLARAAAQHASLLDKINKFESDLRCPPDPASLLTIRHLAAELSGLFEAMEYKDIAVVGIDCDTLFWLKGSVADLFNLIEPLVRNGIATVLDQRSGQSSSDLSDLFLADVENHNYEFWIDPYEVGKSTKVLIGAHIPFTFRSTATLNIRIADAGIGIPADLIELLKQGSAFSRLPSTRLDGGRGLLSVITAIQSIYKGHCGYYEEEKAWKIEIPVKLEVDKTPTEREEGPL